MANAITNRLDILFSFFFSMSYTHDVRDNKKMGKSHTETMGLSSRLSVLQECVKDTDENRNDAYCEYVGKDCLASRIPTCGVCVKDKVASDRE